MRAASVDCQSPKTVYGRRSPGRRVNRPLGFGRRHVVAGEGDSELGAWKARSGRMGRSWAVADYRIHKHPALGPHKNGAFFDGARRYIITSGRIEMMPSAGPHRCSTKGLAFEGELPGRL